MTPTEAEALAAATLAAIPEWTGGPDALFHQRQADRERVESDLAGLREHRPMLDPVDCSCGFRQPCPDARRYADGLRRTAALYGVTK